MVSTLDNGPGLTREHLLEAAGEVFADVGYRGATVRQICDRAGTNVAAINYHFGDKEALYLAVLKQSYRAAVEKFPMDLGATAPSTPEKKLKAFVQAFLLRIFSTGPTARHGRLMAREMIDPTAALDAMVRDEIRPMSQALDAITRELLGPDASEETVRRCGMSVVSQILFYHHCRPVVSRLFPRMSFEPAEMDRLTEHITRFSLAGFAQMSGSPTNPLPVPGKPKRSRRG